MSLHVCHEDIYMNQNRFEPRFQPICFSVCTCVSRKTRVVRGSDRVEKRIAGAGRWRQPSRGGWREGGGEIGPADRYSGYREKLGLKQQDKSWRSIKYFLCQLQKLVYHRSCRNLTRFFCHMSLLFMLRLPNKYVPHQMTTVTSFSDVTSWDVSFFSGSSRWNFARNVNRSGWLHWRGSPKAATAFAGWDLKPPPKKTHENALGGGNSNMFYVHPFLGKMIQFH